MGRHGVGFSDLKSKEDTPLVARESIINQLLEAQHETECVQDCVPRFYQDNEFVLHIVFAILLAKVYPPVGAVYLRPDITSTWVAVVFMFVIAGVGLKTEELSRAFQRLKFNFFVQTFNFVVVSLVCYVVSRLLIQCGALSSSLGDGLVVCASLPVTISMILVLTKTAGGDEAAAIFNAAFGNLVGVFLSPALIIGYLGVTGDIVLVDVFYKLSIRVVAPLTIGQLLRTYVSGVKDFHKRNKKGFKKAQQLVLVYIVYTVFCKTFAQVNSDVKIRDVLVMMVVTVVLLICLKILAWWSLGALFPNEPRLRIMGLYGCTQKTVAMGVPLINAIYEGDPAVGIYTLPLLVWHPTQLVIGSYLAPKLRQWAEDEEFRLGIDIWSDISESFRGSTRVSFRESFQIIRDLDADEGASVA